MVVWPIAAFLITVDWAWVLSKTRPIKFTFVGGLVTLVAVSLFFAFSDRGLARLLCPTRRVKK
jgi:putative flippase GtrA